MSAETNPDQFPGESLIDREGWEELVAPDKDLHSNTLVLEELDSTTRPTLRERAVYLALRTMPVFLKYPTKCKKSRLVTAISKRRHFEAVSALYNNHDAEAIHSMAFRLYKSGAFTDKEVAAKMFPDDNQEYMEGNKKKDPVYLHSLAQLPLVAALQKVVAYTCYAYVNEKQPCILQDRGWNQAESADLGQLLSVTRIVKDGSVGMAPDESRLFELMGELSQASVKERKDALKLAETLRITESFVGLLKNRSGQIVINLLRSGTEVALNGLITKGLAHQARVQEGMSRIAAERGKLDQEEKNMVNAFQDEERAFVKDATTGVIRGVRMAEDALVDEFLEI